MLYKVSLWKKSFIGDLMFDTGRYDESKCKSAISVTTFEVAVMDDVSSLLLLLVYITQTPQRIDRNDYHQPVARCNHHYDKMSAQIET